MQITKTGFATLIVGLCLCASAEAVLLNYNPAQSATARGDGPYTIGTLFQVGATNQLITHLGAQDADAAVDIQDPDGADGMTGFADNDGFFRDTFAGGAGISVGLWDATGTTLLGQVVVSSSDPYINGWRYKALSSPVTLTAGTTYLIGAHVGGGIEWFLDNGTGPAPFSASPDFTILQNRFIAGAALAAPTSNGAGTLGRWGAANAIAILPEPATASLGLLSLAGLMLRRRRAA